MSELKMSGVIERIGEIKEISESFKTLEFVIKTNGEYPQNISFQITNDKADNFLNNYKLNDSIDVYFNIRGKNWTNNEGVIKTFNTLDVWRVTNEKF